MNTQLRQWGSLQTIQQEDSLRIWIKTEQTTEMQLTVK